MWPAALEADTSSMNANTSSANSARSPADSPFATLVAAMSRQAVRAPMRYAASRASIDRPLRASPRPRA